MERQLIHFVNRGYATKEKLTQVWEAWSVTQYLLGQIKWYGPWRRYCFYPADGTVLDNGCLLEIAGFTAVKTEERKAAWTNKTKRARGE